MKMSICGIPVAVSLVEQREGKNLEYAINVLIKFYIQAAVPQGPDTLNQEDCSISATL